STIPPESIPLSKCRRENLLKKSLQARMKLIGLLFVLKMGYLTLFRYKIFFPEVEIKILNCNENLPFKNDSYDLIFAGEIIEHLIDPNKFLSEIKRILKPEGLFIGSTPNAFRYDKRIKLLMGKDPKTFSDLTHLQYFSFDSLKQKLGAYFTEILISSYPTDFFSKYFYKLTSSGFIWQAKK
ncbi:methyltransferase domain-containing protein, partial [Candidatus Nomurabacteria bacterium]|nr:methyltransferase domain-containing protein [Candidatus Nomurabacteria bacterium]